MPTCCPLLERPSLRRLETNFQIDPLSVGISLSLGWTYFYAHRYERAIQQFRKTLTLNSNFIPAHEGLARSYQQEGMEKEAIAEFQTELELSGNKDLAAALGRTYEISGYRGPVEGLLRTQLAP